jgi:hypothetical protein
LLRRASDADPADHLEAELEQDRFRWNHLPQIQRGAEA